MLIKLVAMEFNDERFWNNPFDEMIIEKSGVFIQFNEEGNPVRYPIATKYPPTPVIREDDETTECTCSFYMLHCECGRR